MDDIRDKVNGKREIVKEGYFDSKWNLKHERKKAFVQLLAKLQIFLLKDGPKARAAITQDKVISLFGSS